MDTWVILEDAPHPNAAYAFLNFIQDPEIQAKETETQPATRRRTTRRRSSSTRRSSNNPTVFVPRGHLTRASSKRAQDVSTDQTASEIWEEFESNIGG